MIVRQLLNTAVTSCIGGGKGGGRVIGGYHYYGIVDSAEDDGCHHPSCGSRKIQAVAMKNNKNKRVRFKTANNITSLPVAGMEEGWDRDDENHDPQHQIFWNNPSTQCRGSSKLAASNCCEDDFATSVWDLDVHSIHEEEEEEEDSEVTAIIVNGSNRRKTTTSPVTSKPSSSHRGEDVYEDEDDEVSSQIRKKETASRRGRRRQSRNSERGHRRRHQRHSSSSPSIGSSSARSCNSRRRSNKRLRRSSPSPSLSSNSIKKKGRGRGASPVNTKEGAFHGEYARQRSLLDSPFRLSNLSYSDRVMLASPRPFSSSSITPTHHLRRLRSPSPRISSSQRTCRSLPTLQHLRQRSMSPSVSSSQRTSRSLGTLLQASSSSSLQLPPSSSQSYSRLTSSLSSLQSSRSSLSTSASTITSSTPYSSSFHRRISVQKNTMKVGEESFQSKCHKINLVF